MLMVALVLPEALDEGPLSGVESVPAVSPSVAPAVNAGVNADPPPGGAAGVGDISERLLAPSEGVETTIVRDPAARQVSKIIAAWDQEIERIAPDKVEQFFLVRIIEIKRRVGILMTRIVLPIAADGYMKSPFF